MHLLIIVLGTFVLPSAFSASGGAVQFTYVGPLGSPTLTVWIDEAGKTVSSRGHVAERADPCSDSDMVVCINSSFLPFAIPLDFEARTEWAYGHYRYHANATPTSISIWGASKCVYVIMAEPNDNQRKDAPRLDSWTFLFNKQYGLLMALRRRAGDPVVEVLYSQDETAWGAAVLEGEAPDCGVSSDSAEKRATR